MRTRGAHPPARIPELRSPNGASLEGLLLLVHYSLICTDLDDVRL
jgi:hypothetical protein